MKDTQIITFENETIGTIRGLLDEKNAWLSAEGRPGFPYD